MSLKILLSKCCACSIRNCEPCSHCRSSSCSRLCGAPLVDELEAPLSIDVNDAGPEEVVVEVLADGNLL